MPAFSELSPRPKRNEIARWLLLVPGAVLASVAVRQTVGAVVRAMRLAGSLDLGGAGFWLATVSYYALPMFALVVAGGRIAPRRPLAAALVLAGVGGGLSLLKHVVMQHLSGNRVGAINWIHFSLEMTGLVAGAVCISRWRRVSGFEPPRDAR
ncbi:hypothetical protein [Planctomyces sp. SH-PL14]|uniref:hypothetical protein n=1 Tax=Planctomyces sp. SH-PL14 TaxID=1632864 RepID=UPI00078E1AC6|nr:hypothetical protein [Planctomyces sp. SH-PL14]AMV17514.1 hypothetical protein VT03_06455 [Planctomyces sp. SH-PL14]